MLGLELLLRSLVIVDQGKACAASATKMRSESKGNDTAFVSLVEGGKLLGEVGFRDVGARRVENINDELAASQKTVGNELSCAEGNGG